ncbi:hypothetical protein B484DRAFT_390920, partial [Ochromonadaceae sp. CCMP2298]
VTVAQVTVSLFKFCWHRFGMRYLIRRTAAHMHLSGYAFSRTEFFGVQLSVTVFNNEDFCTHYDPTIHEFSYTPPFEYSYQCSASFVTYYAPAFVFLCIITTFFAPLAQIGVVWLYSRAAGGGTDTEWFRLLNRLVPKILKPVGWVE